MSSEIAEAINQELACLMLYDENAHRFDNFRKTIHDFLESHPRLRRGDPPVVHSVKSRLKDREHLRRKLKRKAEQGDPITAATFFARLTDLAGVRVLHLYLDQFAEIHSAITRQIESEEWSLHEKPKAYTWDPEHQEIFKREPFGLDVIFRPTLYTSVHYVIRPNPKSNICCEIQVRTLFEEIWGEVDHSINYPEPSRIIACTEQLRVLSKLVGAGSRLVDSIYRTLSDDAVRRSTPLPPEHKSDDEEV